MYIVLTQRNLKGHKLEENTALKNKQLTVINVFRLAWL